MKLTCVDVEKKKFSLEAEEKEPVIFKIGDEVEITVKEGLSERKYIGDIVNINFSMFGISLVLLPQSFPFDFGNGRQFKCSDILNIKILRISAEDAV